MMKKSIVVFLIAVMLTMVACGKKTEKTPRSEIELARKYKADYERRAQDE